MKKRYEKNLNMLTEEEMLLLNRSKIAIVGCGGLGGHVIEQFVRLGIGYLTVVDGDVFDETNLNRQLLSSMEVLGQSKAITAKIHGNRINPDVKITPIVKLLDENNIAGILAGHQIVIDAVDNIKTRMLLQEKCEELGIPLIHGAIAGWYGQVTTIFPGDRTLDVLYKSEENHGIEKELGNPSFTPALVASLQVSEALKALIGRGELLRKRVLYIDLLEQEFMHLNL